MSDTYVSAAPGHSAIYVIDGKIIRRTIVAWEVSRDFAWPVTMFKDENLSIEATHFPDGHVESLRGQKRWATLDEFRKAFGL